MDMKKRLAALFMSAAMWLGAVPCAGEESLEEMPAASIAVYECTTGEELFEKNSHEVMPMSHMAKLMTLLIAAESLESGEMSLTDTVTVSDRAASLGGVTVWLERGEKIPAEDLIKAITVGNANDAALALAEHISGSEEAFILRMTRRAGELGMGDTVFKDCTGLSEDTVSTAADIALLCCELSRHRLIRPYVTSYMDTVRDGRAELVNHDRLVRTYKGITGMKACVSERAGECAAVSAEKEYLHPVAVVLGADSQDNCMDMARLLLDSAFEGYSLYVPEISEEMLSPVPVTGGSAASVPVTFGELAPAVIRKGSSRGADLSLERIESFAAPVKKGTPAGSLTVRSGDTVIYSAELVAAEPVPELTFREAFFRLMCNLWNMQ